MLSDLLGLRALPLSFSDSCEISLSFAASVSGTSSPLFPSRLDTGFSTGLPALVAQCFPRFPSPSLRPVLSALFPTYATQVFFISPTRVYLFSSQLTLPFLASGSSDLFAVAFTLHIVFWLSPITFRLSVLPHRFPVLVRGPRVAPKRPHTTPPERQIGRASCREKCRSRWSPYH